MVENGEKECLIMSNVPGKFAHWYSRFLLPFYDDVWENEMLILAPLAFLK